MKEIEEWKMSLSRKSEATVNSYMHDLGIFLDWVKENKKVNEVNLKVLKSLKLKDFEKYIYYLDKERNNSKSSTNRRIISLKQFFKYLRKHKLIREDITLDLNCEKTDEREPKYLTNEELIELESNISGFQKIRDLAIIALGTEAGLRISEMFNINIEDIRKDGLLRIIGKGNKERFVPINEKLKQRLNDWLRIRPNIPVNKKGTPLFITRKNKRIEITTIRKMVEKNLKRIKREDCTTHSLRHTFATRLLEKGVELIKIQELLGHKEITTTTVYTHVNKDQLIEAVNLLDEAS